MKSYYSLIGIDFSLAKPAACVFYNNKYKFISWPKDLSSNLIKLYRNSDIEIIDRTDIQKDPKDSSEKVRHHINSANILASLIIDTFKPYLNKNTFIALEGSSFGSKGDVVIQLTSYRYFLMNQLSSIVPLNNMFTYAPISIKKTAECSGKGKTKNDMIDSFIINGPNCKLKENLKKDKNSFMKKGFKNYQTHLDDIIDSYWVLKTLENKQF